MRHPNFAIIGAGNGGQSMAAHLKLLGFHVALCAIAPEKAKALRQAGKISLAGVLSGETVVDLITDDIGLAVRDADVIMVVVPAVYQGSIAAALSPHLSDRQIIVLNPGATGGSLEVCNVLAENKCKADVIIAETNTLLYTCRSLKPGEAIVYGIKERIEVAALPAEKTTEVLSVLRKAFPQFVAVPNILHTSLGNPNSIMHPAPTLLNAGRIESQLPFDYYTEGVTPSIARVVEAVDLERIAVCSAFGIELGSIRDWYMGNYGAQGDSLYEKLQKVDAYKGVKGPNTLNTRYLFEDIPTGLVPLAGFGQAIGVETPTINALVELANKILSRNYWEEGRSLHKLGLKGKSVQEILDFVS